MKRMLIPVATLISAALASPAALAQKMMRFDGKQWNFFGEVMGK